MLPDLPDLKSDLFNALMKLMRNWQQECMGPLKDCRTSVMFEGDRHGIKRPTGESDMQPFWQISSAVTLEPQNDDLESCLVKIQEMAAQFATQIQQQSFAYLNDTMERFGQVVNAEGRDNLEPIFEMIEKVQIPLDDEGRLDMSSMKFVGGSGHIQKWDALMQSEDGRRRLDEILKRKEEEAHAREANRELVG